MTCDAMYVFPAPARPTDQKSAPSGCGLRETYGFPATATTLSRLILSKCGTSPSPRSTLLYLQDGHH